MTPEIDAAHRALRGVVLHGEDPEDYRRDITTAGAAFVGVLSAFFRNVMESAFTGQEPVEQVRAYLKHLKRSHPSELSSLKPARAAEFVLEQIGPEAPPPGYSSLLGGADLVARMTQLAFYTAKQEGLSGEHVEMCLFGATARYSQGW